MIQVKCVIDSYWELIPIGVSICMQIHLLSYPSPMLSPNHAYVTSIFGCVSVTSKERQECLCKLIFEWSVSLTTFNCPNKMSVKYTCLYIQIASFLGSNRSVSIYQIKCHSLQPRNHVSTYGFSLYSVTENIGTISLPELQRMFITKIIQSYSI